MKLSRRQEGRTRQIGVPGCVVADGNGFVLDHEIMWKGGDTDVAAPLIRRCLKAVPELRGCSFDRGFHCPSNRKTLDGLLELNALPKKGGKSAAEREREASPAFAAARRKHSGVESMINNLERRGLDKVRLRGADGFELAVGLSVVAPDIHRLGLNLREAARKRMRRLSGASPETGRPQGGNRRSLRQRCGKPERTRNRRPPEPESASRPLSMPATGPLSLSISHG